MKLPADNLQRIKFAMAMPLLALAYLIAVWFWPLNLTNAVHIVKPGASMTRVAQDLYKNDVLPDRFSMRLLARLTGVSTKIKAGEYAFKTGMSQRQILSALVNGDQVVYSLLVIEGTTFSDFLITLSQHPKTGKNLIGLSAAQIMERLSYGQQHPEGRFYPDTYTFTAGTPDMEILRKAYVTMQKELATLWEGRAPDLPYKNSDEALIMASIVEKETGRPEDRSRIAAVFVNRLRKRMRLQTDPTVIYGIGSKFDGNIRRRDLLKDTPYNTYTRSGLPPTPISLPGRDSIRAALHPAPTNDLYFVSRGDGTSQFSETLRQHNKAVRQYQLGGRKNQGSKKQ